MRPWLLWAMLLVTPLLRAEVHERGEFRFSVEPVPAFVKPIDVADGWPATAPGSDDQRWRNWLFDLQVDRSGTVPVRYSDHAYEPLSPELIGEAARIQASFNPAFEELVLHRVQVRRDGAWSSRLDAAKVTLARRETDFERDLSDGAVTALLVLDDVRAGDVVRFSYSIRGSNPVLAGSEHDEAVLAWVDPLLRRHVRVLYPAGTRLDIRKEPALPAATVREAAGKVEAVLDLSGIDRVRDEGGAPVWHNAFPRIQLAPRRSWKDVQAWALPLYPMPDRLPEELEQRVTGWRAIADPQQRLAAVLQVVQSEVRYFGIEMGENSHRPTDPAITWQRRYGDCKDKAYLMSAVLRRLGIEAVPALVSSARGRDIGNAPAAASMFDHVIVMATLADGVYWLDPTLTQQRAAPGQLDLYDFGFALPISDRGTGLVKVVRPATAANSLKVLESYVPLADGKGVMLTVKTDFGGGPAERMRRNLASKGLDEVGRQYSDYYAKRFGKAEVVAPLSVTETADGNALQLIESYRLPQALNAVSGSSLALDVYAESIGSDLGQLPPQSRLAPLALSYPMDFRHEMRLDMPEQWEWLGEPEQEKVEADEFRYSRRMAREGNAVSILHEARILSDHVPAGKLAGHYARIHQVSDGLNRRFLLRPSTALREDSREKRLQDLLRNVLDE